MARPCDPLVWSPPSWGVVVDRHLLVAFGFGVAPMAALAALLALHVPKAPETALALFVAGADLLLLAALGFELRRLRRVESASGVEVFRYAWWVRHGYLAMAVAGFLAAAVLWGAGSPEKERRGAAILFAVAALNISCALPLWLRTLRATPDVAWTEAGLRVRFPGEGEALVAWQELRGVGPLASHPLGPGLTLEAGERGVPISTAINGYTDLCVKLADKAAELGLRFQPTVWPG